MLLCQCFDCVGDLIALVVLRVGDLVALFVASSLFNGLVFLCCCCSGVFVVLDIFVALRWCFGCPNDFYFVFACSGFCALVFLLRL